MRSDNNLIELVGVIKRFIWFADGKIVRMELDTGERWPVYAQVYQSWTAERVKAELKIGDMVKIVGFVKIIDYYNREIGESKLLGQISVRTIEPVTGGALYQRWMLNGRLVSDIIAYSGRGFFGKFKLRVTAPRGDETDYPVIIREEALAERMERATEAGMILTLYGTLGKYVVRREDGEKLWRPCMYLTEWKD